MKTLLVTTIPDSLLDLPKEEQVGCLEVAIAATYCSDAKEILSFLEQRHKYYSLGQILEFLGYLRTGKKINKPIEKAKERDLVNIYQLIEKYSDFPREKVVREANRIVGWFYENNIKPYKENVDKLLQRALFLQTNKTFSSFSREGECVSCGGKRYYISFFLGGEQF